MEHTVLIAGAGPTGLLLGYELALQGVDVAILERDLARTGQSKALSLQPRTAEILHNRGLLEPLLADSIDRIPAGHFAGLPEPLDYRRLDTRFGFQLGIPQARVERLLEQRVTAMGVPVYRGRTLTGVDQDADRVVVTTSRTAGPGGSGSGGSGSGGSGSGGSGRIAADYLVGCDGARSATRKAVGVDFVGRDGHYRAVVADIAVDDHRPGRSDRWELPRLEPSAAGAVTLLPLEPGTMRILFAGPGQQELPITAPVTTDEVATALRLAVGGQVTLRDIHWASRFTDACRQAERYREGRVLLAGDAAHIHPPTGGQGLNLGLQDAMNLGWKLAMHLRGLGADDLLDSYNRERHPVAERVIADTRAQGVLLIADPEIACLRGTFRRLLDVPEANRALAAAAAGLDICYGRSEEGVGARMPDLDLITDYGPTTVAQLLEPGRPVLLCHPAGELAPSVASAGDEEGGGDPHGRDLQARDLQARDLQRRNLQGRAVQDMASAWGATVVVGTSKQPWPWRHSLIRPDGYLASCG